MEERGINFAVERQRFLLHKHEREKHWGTAKGAERILALFLLHFFFVTISFPDISLIEVLAARTTNKTEKSADKKK